MVDVESLSNAKLRTKLMEYGYPVMPITATTRKFMVRKIKLLMKSKNKPNKDNSRSLGRHSSEEESDSDVRATRKYKNRRTTMAAPLLKPTSSKRVTWGKSLRWNDSDDINEAGASSTLKNVSNTTKRTTTTKVLTKLQFDTGSGSESEIVENNFDSSPPASNSYEYKKELPIQNAFSPSSPFQFRQSAKYLPPKTAGSTIKTPSFCPINFERPAHSTPVENNEEKVETPYFLSNFPRRRRFSPLSSSSPKAECDFKNNIIKEHDTNGAGSYTRSYLGRSTRCCPVSFGVLDLAVLFFLAVGIILYYELWHV